MYLNLYLEFNSNNKNINKLFNKNNKIKILNKNKIKNNKKKRYFLNYWPQPDKNND